MIFCWMSGVDLESCLVRQCLPLLFVSIVTIASSCSALSPIWTVGGSMPTQYGLVGVTHHLGHMGKHTHAKTSRDSERDREKTRKKERARERERVWALVS